MVCSKSPVEVTVSYSYDRIPCINGFCEMIYQSQSLNPLCSTSKLVNMNKHEHPAFFNFSFKGGIKSKDGGFDKKIIWAIINEKAHLYSPPYGARAECNTNKAKGSSGSHRTARTGALGHSRVLWATAQLGMHGAPQTRL